MVCGTLRMSAANNIVEVNGVKDKEALLQSLKPSTVNFLTEFTSNGINLEAISEEELNRLRIPGKDITEKRSNLTKITMAVARDTVHCLTIPLPDGGYHWLSPEMVAALRKLGDSYQKNPRLNVTL